ncbi:UDP-Glycosyltransferase superfamily protein [Tasmannia lanceolata]|uniref:UDP-Glycosyltransferase superfamily protein n=1 Tax=Tasmannia lanceolata TaxID=3420 RepID=UPI0040634110
MKSQQRQRIIMVPYPAQGHITPMLQLATAFCDRGLQPVVVVPNFIYNRIVSRAKVDKGIVLESIPDGLEEDEQCNFFTIGFAMENYMPIHLEHLLRGFLEGDGVVCVVVDLLASWAIDVAGRCGIPAAGFWPAMFATYNLISAIPDMIRIGLITENGTPLHRGLARILPGQPMLNTEELPWLVGNSASRKSRFMFWLKTLHRSRSLPWLLVNSFSEGDDEEQLLTSPLVPHPRIFQVRPLTRQSKSNPSLWEEDRTCIDWLNSQKTSSVMYVSFGSWVGPIGDEMIRELALGLEATQRPFIWVLGATWRAGLPSGYLDRVAGHGKVVTWAPQKEVLEHVAVGCYLTHCGWNSTMEAIECRKPLLCYPVSGDQFLNCSYIVRVWGIGIQLDEMERTVIEDGVRRVMEDGAEMRTRVMDLKGRLMGKEARARAADSLTAFFDALDSHRAGIDDCLSCITSSV